MTKPLHAISLPLTFIFLWNYVRDWYGLPYIYGMDQRPFIYRVLVPMLVKGLVWLGARYDLAVIAIVSLSLAGFTITLYRLYLAFWNDKTKAVLVCYTGTWLLLLLIWKDRKIYDTMTAFLMTLSILLIVRGKLSYFAIVFAAMCLNRETAFLAAILFAVWFWRRMELSKWLMWLTYQAMMFGIVQAAIRIAYADQGGMGNLFRLRDNIRFLTDRPAVALFLSGAIVVFLWFVLLGWSAKPLFLRVAFLSLIPIAFVLYLASGYIFEPRVFAEVYPVAMLMMFQN